MAEFDFIAVRDRLRALYPAIGAYAPLALGTRQRLAAEAEEHGYSLTSVRRFMKKHTRSKRYLANMATAGGWRYTLAMEPAEPVSDRDRLEAAERVERRKPPPPAAKPEPAEPPAAKASPPAAVSPRTGRPILTLKNRKAA